MFTIAANQPDIQQKYIAEQLEITPQAVSDYIKQLQRDGLLASTKRSRYRLSIEGIDWLIKQARDARELLDSVEQVIGSIKVSAAIAGDKLAKGQKVGVVIRNGLLYAIPDETAAAQGVVEADVEAGEDVGISSIQGKIRIEPGRITVAEVPTIQKGGSATTNLDSLKQAIVNRSPVIATGIEAIVALERIGVKPDYIHAAKEAAIEAARTGLSPLVVCVEEEILSFASRIKEAGLDYNLIDLKQSPGLRRRT